METHQLPCVRGEGRFSTPLVQSAMRTDNNSNNNNGSIDNDHDQVSWFRGDPRFGALLMKYRTPLFIRCTHGVYHMIRLSCTIDKDLASPWPLWDGLGFQKTKHLYQPKLTAPSLKVGLFKIILIQSSNNHVTQL